MNTPKRLLTIVFCLAIPIHLNGQEPSGNQWGIYLSEVNKIRLQVQTDDRPLHNSVNRKWLDYMREVVQLDNYSDEKLHKEDAFLNFLKDNVPLPDWFEEDFRTGFHSDNTRYFFSPIGKDVMEIGKRFYSMDSVSRWKAEGKSVSIELPWGKEKLSDEYLQLIPIDSYLAGAVNDSKDKFALVFFNDAELGDVIEVQTPEGFLWRQRLANPPKYGRSGPGRQCCCSLAFSGSHVWLFALNRCFARIQRFEQDCGKCDFLWDSRGFEEQKPSRQLKGK